MLYLDAVGSRRSGDHFLRKGEIEQPLSKLHCCKYFYEKASVIVMLILLVSWLFLVHFDLLVLFTFMFYYQLQYYTYQLFVYGLEQRRQLKLG